jgi:hypothetical protein
MKEIINLCELSGLNELSKYYNNNKDKNFHKWLEFNETFTKPGKQGLVGLLKSNSSNSSNLTFVFKISQYINYLVQHEYTVMNGLNDISPYCLHFCKSIGTVLCEVDPKCRKSGNPFEITSKHPIEKEVLLTEYVENSTKLYNYIKSSKIKDNILYNTFKQVLLAIAIAQKEKKFTHYDLHSYNIMMKQCDKDLVFLYVLDEENQFCVPTFGHYPVIIDFGFSYIKDMDKGPAWASLAHTDVGFMSDRYDPIADPKLFLVSVAYEMKKQRNNSKTIKFRNVIKNIFGNLELDWESGWDNVEDKGASNFVIEMLHGYNKHSNIFDNYDHYCIDIIQSLIILPLQEQKYTDIDISYTTFLTEFVKIENEIGNPFYNIYILKGIVDIAREVRSDYMSKNQKSRTHAVTFFRQSVFERINCVANYCRPKNIHFEKMLCSLLNLAKNVEGILYDVIETRMKQKNKEYSRLPLKTVEEIYGALDVNFPDNYIFNENTTVLVMDSVSKNSYKLKLNREECNIINNTYFLSRGTVLYEIYKKD